MIELMIMASYHQTFSDNLTDQIKFDQTNLLYIINGKTISMNGKTNENKASVQTTFRPHHKH